MNVRGKTLDDLTFSCRKRVLELLLLELLLTLVLAAAPPMLLLDVSDQFRTAMECRDYGGDSTDDLDANGCQS